MQFIHHREFRLFLALTSHTRSIVRVLVIPALLLGGPRTRRRATVLATIAGPSGLGPESSLLLKLAPSLHRDLRAIEFALVLNPGFLGLLARCLASVAPGKVVELPEGVHGEDEIPDREREEVDEHP